jgi:D-beta-D-heptose 7-phosphate kinase / D-beta-D-heptose 1-phosphate adenosyltransferase
VISRLVQTVESFAGKRVLLIGDYVLDQYVSGDAEEISSEAPVPVLRVVHKEQRAGGSGSVAADLAALGISVVCCGVLGRDEAGRQVVELLEKGGCSAGGLIFSSDRPTIVRTRFIGLAQHRHPQQLVRVEEGGAVPLSEDLADRLCHDVEARLPDADIVCVRDSHQGVLTDAATQRMIQAARKEKIPVLADPAPGVNAGRYRGATLLTPNRNEFRLMTGHAAGGLESYRQPALALRDRLGLEALVITVDSDGALLIDRNAEFHHVPTRTRAVYDNTGAGDAILAMFAAALAAGAPLEDAVLLANIAGGLEVEKFGNVPIPQSELLADLRLQDDRRSKVRTESELLAELAIRKNRGDKIVFTNGCFDLLHIGHYQLLAQCKELGDVLVVAVNSDRSVRVNKGPERPICNEDVRSRMLAALESVDYVLVFDTETPLELIQKIRPDVLCKGGDYKGGWVCGREVVEGYGGRVEVLSLFEGYSTTRLVDRIRNGA